MLNTVLITGCSSGFGLEMVRLFLKKNWRVIATLRNPAVSKELRSFPQENLIIVKLDVTKSEAQLSLVTDISKQINGQLNCLINNAGFGLVGPFESLTVEQIRYQMEVNFIGLALLTQAFLPMLRATKGRLINISSVCGFLGFPLHSLYCASKHAVDGLSKALHYELKPHGIQVCSVQPGAHRSNFGKNIIDGNNMEQALENEIYKKQINKLIKFRDNLGNNKNASSALVANIIVKLAEQKKMPLHVKIGNDAKILNLLQSILPERVFNGLFALGCRYVF
jgi:NAD(P)-dependent dehydrogenase (short-subunit alcohol dehydrogenase family)